MRGLQNTARQTAREKIESYRPELSVQIDDEKINGLILDSRPIKLTFGQAKMIFGRNEGLAIKNAILVTPLTGTSFMASTVQEVMVKVKRFSEEQIRPFTYTLV